MSLVAYDSSDDSDKLDEEPIVKSGNDNVDVLIRNNKEGNISVNFDGNKDEPNIKSRSESEVNIALPCPKQAVEDVAWTSISATTKSQHVRIYAPKLSEEEEPNPSNKALKQSVAGSGLFALLPSPKRERLIPKQVTKQQLKIKPVTEKSIKPADNPSALLKLEYSDSEEEDASTSDFFSLLGSKNESSASPTYKPDMIRNIKPLADETVINIPLPTSYSEIIKQKPGITESDKGNDKPKSSLLQLDEVALTHLCGSQAKRRRSGESVELIDVHGAALLPDSNEWLTKELTQEKARQSSKKKGGPTALQRKKHHITYLAHQAKEHELELKTQWANNRMTRKQTQAKYGF